ncbi:MAG: dephospho-CoA kinase [Sedimentisphaerales bacterium]|nr:dephospho-CoA kinase [Sedimentisphaerales bacterium]
MNNIQKKPIIGILGGIASGKSTVAKAFAQLGCKVIDADAIAHELLDEETVQKQIVASFGREILNSTGKIDHKTLAGIVFANSDKLSCLNEILHPLVIERTEAIIEECGRQNRIKAIVLDMPLLVEVGWAERCDRLIYVDCSLKTRLERAQKAGLDKNQLKIRENFQISLDNKQNLADNTVENNSDFLTLVRQVADIFSDIMDDG